MMPRKNAGKNDFYIYLYRDPSRGNERIYVGKGRGRRAWDHLRRKDKHPFIHRLQKMKRNGVEPVIEFLCTNVDNEFAALCEQEAISLYGRKDLGKGTLLNLTDGGEGVPGLKDSPETRLRKSISAKNKPPATPEACANLSAALKGKPKSEEHCANLAASARNRSQEARVKIATKLGKPCTIDGITIYPSKIAMKRAIGRNKDGAGSSNFRFVEK
jgi:hypothetical protein